MRLCPNCLKVLPRDIRYCPYCGEALTLEAAAAQFSQKLRLSLRARILILLGIVASAEVLVLMTRPCGPLDRPWKPGLCLGATPLPAYSWRVIRHDTFDKYGDWSSTGKEKNDDVSVLILFGQYHVAAQSRDRPIFSSLIPSHNAALSDLYMTVEAQEIYGVSSGLGLAFRVNQAGLGYFFLIDFQSFTVLLRDASDHWKTLIDLDENSAIQPYKVNRLAILAQGSHFTFFINDQQIGEVDDDTFGSGMVGLAYRIAETNWAASFAFDNFEVRAP
jgi:hypothetical protein